MDYHFFQYMNSFHWKARLNHREGDGGTYFVVPALNAQSMQDTIFTISNREIAWNTSMVSGSEIDHLHRRQ